MANPKNKQNNQNESTQQNQSNVSEFNRQSSQGDTSSFGGTSSPAGATSTPGVTGAGGGISSPGGTSAQGTGQGAGAATATARSFIDQAKETAGQAYEAVTDKAATKLDERKSSLTTGLTTVADSVRQVSANFGSSETDSGLAEAAAKYTNTAAQKIQDAAGYFENRSVREMARDIEGFARRNPAVFFGTAFTLGILAARFLKSTPTRQNEMGAGRQFASSAGTADRQLSAPLSQSSKGEFSTGKEDFSTDKGDFSTNPR